MKIIKPPNSLSNIKNSVFLAGSIEQDKAENWQKYIEIKLNNTDITILNPRRDSWNANWEQNIENPEFNQQVNWELESLEKADLILMYFAPNTKSPISLLELGLFAKSGKMIVCCPKGFWRKGNVDIVCQRYNIMQVEKLDELVEHVIKYFEDSTL